MPRHASLRTLAHLCLCLLVSGTLVLAHPNHEDSKKSYLEAEAANGLHGDNLKPWRLKISYKFLDPSGQSTEQGTVEEVWANKELHKLTITEPSAKLVLLHNQKGFFREGELDRKSALLVLLAREFTDPMPFSERSLSTLNFVERTQDLGSAQLRCFKVSSPDVFNDPALCLENNSPMVRITSTINDRHEFTFVHVGKFQDRYVPIDVIAGQGAQPDVSAHVDSLEQVPSIGFGDFQPGKDAVELIQPSSILLIPEDTLQSMIDHRHKLFPIRRPEPVYPDAAREANVHGTVRMRAVIDTDGHISALNVVDGPQLLREAALDAVWKWRFEKPFADKGPARIITTVSVRF